MYIYIHIRYIYIYINYTYIYMCVCHKHFRNSTITHPNILSGCFLMTDLMKKVESIMAGGVSENLCPNIKLLNWRGILSLWTCPILGNLQFLQLQLKDLSQTTHLIPFRKGEKRSHFCFIKPPGFRSQLQLLGRFGWIKFRIQKLNDLKLIFQCKLD